MAPEESQLPAVKGTLLFRAGSVRRERNAWKGIRKFLAIGSCVVLAQSGALLLLAGMMKRRRRRNELAHALMQKIIQVREDEHLHLARELHDNIGQRLSLLSMRLASLRSQGTNNDREIADTVREVDALISEVHSLSHSMHSSRLEHLGLEDALTEVCSEVSKRYPLQVDLQVTGEPERPPARPDPRVSLCFYRIAQEALNNVVKHSHASEAQIFLFRSGERLAMEVIDFGVGFDRKMTPVGIGLASIEERILSVHGAVSIESEPGKGTAIRVEAPTHPFDVGELQVGASANDQRTRKAPQFS
jgi:signal transduction histidine kinase